MLARFFVPLLLVWAGPALAQSTELYPEDQAGLEQCLQSAWERGARPEECIGFVEAPCLDTEEGQSTAGMVGCAAREHAFWDALLKQTYQELRDGATEEEQVELRDLQRLWLDWRQERCAYEAVQYEGGTFANVVANRCFLEETARRAIDLVETIEEDNDRFRLDP